MLSFKHYLAVIVSLTEHFLGNFAIAEGHGGSS